MVDLVLLHGPPASGKLTVAKALNVLIGARVFHNHLTLDVAKSLIDFGEPGFWDLVRDLRLLSLQSYFKHGDGIAIATWCYEEPADWEQFIQIKSIATSAKGRVLPVHLRCDISYLEERVENAHRRDMEKLCDVKQLRNIMAHKNYSAIPDALSIEVNTGVNSVDTNVRKIVKAFSL